MRPKTSLICALIAVITIPVWANAEDLGPVAKTGFNKHAVVDKFGRTVTYYISRPAKPAPLMLIIQGSGCTSVFLGANEGTASTIYGLFRGAQDGRLTVMAVDKPFGGEKPGGQKGTAVDCSAAFNQDFTAERWLEALHAALTDARKLPWVDRSRTLVWGHSEGAVMAGLVAGREPFVTDVVWFAGAATTQMFDQFAIDDESCFDRTACLEAHERGARAIMAKPDSGTDFIWGHSYKRWASFYRVSSVDELLKSKARVYAADGTADRNSSYMSLELLAATLISAGHDVTVRRVPNADHSLNGPESSTASEYERAFDWFWMSAHRNGAD